MRATPAAIAAPCYAACLWGANIMLTEAHYPAWLPYMTYASGVLAVFFSAGALWPDKVWPLNMPRPSSSAR